MRFATIITANGPRAAIHQADAFVDVGDSLRDLIAGGREAIHHAKARVGQRGVTSYAANEVRLAPPVVDPPKIICLGLNYRDHAAETGAAIPREPILFGKYATALIGNGQPIVLPPVSQEVDYEAELVVVIGKSGRPKTVAGARDYVAGYMIGNDVSARDWQLKKDGKQWMVGKTFDTFAPTGPMLVTADEIPDPQRLGIRLRLNGQLMQDSNTSQMIFPIPETLVHLAQVMTLQPGDLIFTGTPPGVGMARNPPVWLKDGDVVEVEIDGLGVLRNPVVQGR